MIFRTPLLGFSLSAPFLTTILSFRIVWILTCVVGLFYTVAEIREAWRDRRTVDDHSMEYDIQVKRELASQYLRLMTNRAGGFGVYCIMGLSVLFTSKNNLASVTWVTCLYYGGFIGLQVWTTWAARKDRITRYTVNRLIEEAVTYRARENIKTRSTDPSTTEQATGLTPKSLATQPKGS